MSALEKEGQKNVTLKMIAERAGISIGTVDRAINGRSGISEDRRSEILGMAKEMGYKPNKFASALSRKRELRIGVAYPEISRDFYAYVDAGIDAAEAEMRDFGVSVKRIRYESQDPDIAYKRLSQLNPDDFDALAINAAGAGVDEVIRDFIAAGVRVITFNTDASHSARLFYIGSDSRQSGMMGSEVMGLLTGGRGKVAILGDILRTTSFMERFAGFCGYTQENFPDIEILQCPGTASDTQTAPNGLLTLIGRVPDLTGVFCTGHTSTVSAISALKQAGMKDIRVIGYDISPLSAGALKDGWCDALIYQDPYNQGYLAVTLLAKNLMEDYLPAKPNVYIENRIVLKSNLDSYYKI